MALRRNFLATARVANRGNCTAAICAAKDRNFIAAIRATKHAASCGNFTEAVRTANGKNSAKSRFTARSKNSIASAHAQRRDRQGSRSDHESSIASARAARRNIARREPQKFQCDAQAASSRNFIEIARMINHQIPAENNKTPADSRKIPNKSCCEISAERGAAR